LVLGIVEMHLGNYDSAVDLLNAVSQQMPFSVRAKVWLARAKLRAGDLGAANREFGRALQSSNNHLGALAGRALVRIRRGDMNGAGLDVLGFEKFQRDNPKEVSPPDQALIYYARSEAYRSNADEERANAAYEEAMRFDPINADFPHGLGAWMLKVGRAKEALKPLQQALQTEPGRKAFILSLAEAEIATGDLAGASRRIEDIAAARPKDLQVAIAKAGLMRAKKDPGVEAYLLEVLAWSNDAVMIQRELGEFYRAEGNRKMAEEILEKAVNSATAVPTTDQAEVLMSYGRVMEEKGDVVIAGNTYSMAAEKGSIEALYRACSAYAKTTTDKEKTKGFCARYISAGKTLPYAADAEKILGSL
jgi:tetratricopeptide (TPR) repeat protein